MTCLPGMMSEGWQFSIILSLQHAALMMWLSNAYAGSCGASMGQLEGQAGQQVLEQLHVRCQEHIQKAVRQALPGLAAPAWPLAVVATAAALVAGQAEAVAAQRLIIEV